MKKAVFIDAGHGGVDSGCPLYKGEKYYNLGVALELKKLLTSQGFEVEMSRSSDKSISLNERVQRANSFYQRYGGIFVSIHHNAAQNYSPHGIETFYYSGSQWGFKLASLVSHFASAPYGSFSHNIRGEKNTNKLYVLKNTKAPAILVECEFMTHYIVFQTIRNNEKEWFKHMAKVLYDAIKTYYMQLPKSN